MSDRDDELLERSQAGDRDALDHLLEENLPGLRAYVRLRFGKRLRDHEASSDLVQSVAREVLEKADRFQFGGDVGFRQWLFKTAQRKIAKRARFWAAEKRDAGREQTPTDEGSEVILLGSYRSFYTPSRHAMAREELAAVEAVFDTLSEEHREVILLARVVGLSRAEIGVELGRSEGAVRVLLSRALAQFTARLANVD